jgi:hypothetical protein
VPPKQTQTGRPNAVAAADQKRAPLPWSRAPDKVIKLILLRKNSGKPESLHTRSCQPEFKTCYDAITVVASDGKLGMVKVTKDMNDKIPSVGKFARLMILVRYSNVCYDWDDGRLRISDMKDAIGKPVQMLRTN